MKKKLLSLALAAVMVMSLSATALAADGKVNSENLGLDASVTNTITITNGKTYTATNNDSISPAETFTFTVTGFGVENTASTVTVSNMPAVTVDAISVNSGDASTTGTGHDLVINLPEYESVGVYTYTVVESSSSNAGVTTDATTYYLVVTVVNGNDGLEISAVALHSGSIAGNKVEEIKNEYNAGPLSVTKTVTGNLGDKTKSFEFTVAFTTPSEKNWTPNISALIDDTEYTYNNPVETTDSDGNTVYTITFYLTDGQTITFNNIPYYVTYEVLEDGAGTETVEGTNGYKTTYDVNQSGTIESSSASTTITNTKTGEVDTGINLDTIPYIMILAVVFAGAAYMVFRKRLSDKY